MKEQKVIITKFDSTINSLLREGWIIESVTAQHVSTGSGSHLEGGFCFVIYKKHLCDDVVGTWKDQKIG